MINTNINFMGFYESIHSYFIDQAIESYFSDDDGNFNDKEAENVNYKTIHDSYIKDFTDDFEGWIKDNYPLTPSFCNLKLISPKYYNYSTDVINCDMQKSDVISMNNFFKDDKEFLSYLKDRTKSSSGYISNYSYDDALNNKNDILIDYILEFLVRKFEENYYPDNFDSIYQSILFN
jgi:hypothetical protein